MTDCPTLHFVLLALLSIRPQSGYGLSRTFTEVASHYWSARHSQIYPALAALEADGLVEHRREASERGPERKVYSLTAAGHAALKEWASTPAEEAPLRDEQTVKALCYGLLPSETALAQLGAVRERHAERLATYRSLEADIATPREDDDRPGLPEAARLGILLTLRRGIIYESGYVEWCDQAMELVSDFAPGGDAGSASGDVPPGVTPGA